MNSEQGFRRFRPRLVSLAVASCFATGTALANPTNPAVIHGAANFANPAANVLNVTTATPKTIINWGSFSINANELTKFLQPSAASAVLNRVVGGDPSAILGALQSNGRVLLVNPSGIVFGAGAQIDVAGLVATTLNLSNADFLADRLKFTDMPGAGSVVNSGNITTPQGGNVYLVGPAVTNNGIITSPKGEVVLAAGSSVELVNPGTPNLRVEIAAAENEARNLGQIISESGRIGIYAGLINNSGTIRADSVVNEGGRIVLKATRNTTLEAGSVTTANGPAGGSISIQSGNTTLVAGTVEARGSVGKGGYVEALGNLVGLTGNASINASGDTGGGTVLVGGDFQGKNPEIQNAFRTFVGPDATISADAVTSGDGGKVIVWSDDATRFYGTIGVKGGGQSGDGGFAEVSSKNYLDYRGLTIASAPNGKSGTLLLDPSDVVINDVGNGDGDDGGFDGPVFFLDGSATSFISWSTIAGQLNNSNAIITTSSGASSPGNITTATASPDLASPNKLTLLAHNDILVNNSITNTGGGSVALYAGWDGSDPMSPQVTNGKGTIGINAPISVSGGSSVSIDLVAGKDIFVDSTLTAIAGTNPSSVGGTAQIALSAGTVTINNSTLQAIGGAGAASYGGGAGIVDIQGNDISITGSTLHGQGGGGASGGTGYALVSSNGGVSLSGSIVRGQGGGGSASSGGSGQVSVTSTSNTLDVIGGSLIEALGGAGVSVGGSASVSLESSSVATINVTGSTVRALSGSGGSRGVADVFIKDHISNINITGSTIQADGAEGRVTVSAVGNTTISGGSIISATGASGSFGESATVDVDGSAVTISGSTLSATGGAGSSSGGGHGTVYVYASGSGGLHISGSTISATGGPGNVGGTGFIDLGSGSAGGPVDIGSSTIIANGHAATVDINSDATLAAINSTISANGATGTSGNRGIVGMFASGAIDTSGSTISGVGRTTADGGEGSGVSVENGSGDVTLGLLSSNDIVGVIAAGRIIDGNAGANAVAPMVGFDAGSGIGSLADPLETATTNLFVSTGSGEIGVINQGNLVLANLQNTGSGANAVGTTGTMVFASDINVSGNLSLLANNGMVVEQDIFSGGDLLLVSGIGDLAFDGVSVHGNNVTLVGNNVHVGLTTGILPTEVRATNLMTVGTLGNLNVLGGAEPTATATLAGTDVDLLVGAISGFVNVVTGSTGASAQISAGSPDTITLLFPTLTAGGFFVNGIEGVISDGNTGFFANGQPAVLGDSFMVTYGGTQIVLGGGGNLPSGVEQVIDQVIIATNQQTDLATGDLNKEAEGGNTGNLKEEKEKKSLPVCGK
jgi:filamentous hemagglutinin family protein